MRILAISVAVPVIPPNPSIPATMATRRWFRLDRLLPNRACFPPLWMDRITTRPKVPIVVSSSGAF